MGKITVSVIIPVYNVEAYVGECIASVISQKDAPTMECIIVDDCGTDNSIAVVERILADYSGPIEFKILRHEDNKGLSAARNTGINAAKGKYVYFLDSDDIITNDCIASLYDCACRYPNAQIVVGNLVSFPNGEKFKYLSDAVNSMPEYLADRKAVCSHYFKNVPDIVPNKLIDLKFIRINNLYFKEGVIHEDEHWFGLSYPYVNAIAVVNSVTYLYRLRPGSITNQDGALQRKVANITIIIEDLISRKIKWDKYFFYWVIQWIECFQYEMWEEHRISEAKQSIKRLTGVIVKNPTLPMLIRLVVLYTRFFPDGIGRNLLYRNAVRLTFEKDEKLTSD